MSSPLNSAPNAGREVDRGTIWVVDDSPLEAEVAARLLADQHEVKTFHDPASVLELFAAGLRPDVLVLDWHMPAVSGLEVCRFLRQRFDPASLPILVLTAAGGYEETLESLRAGANDFVAKTSNSEEFQARVRTLVGVRLLHERVRRAELAAQRARRSAEEANNAKDAFMATVSHELRTPLSSIVGWAHLLKESDPDEATLRRGLETIERNAKIQIQLIEDILDTTRVISGKLHLELARMDFAEVVRSAVESLKPAADAKQLRVDCELAPSSTIQGDPDRLQQAVWNLLNNATKFTPAGGLIRVELTSTASEIVLAVTDSGKGISPEFLPHVFDRFRQQDDSASRRHSGLGLGLALVRHLVLAHGGDVSAHSEGQGRGATFRIRLPLESGRPLRPTPTEPTLPPPPSGARDMAIGKLVNVCVLVVEDDADARELLMTLLAGQGAIVVDAASADEALVELGRTRPDVLVSDVGLPGADGFELLRRVRERYSSQQLPAIALTAYARPEDRDLSREAGFQAHLAKPVAPDVLIKLIAEVAGRRARGA